MVIAAGQKLRASEINDAMIKTVRAPSDISKTSSTAFSDVTGFALALEANCAYLFDGYIGYNSIAAADFKLALAVPAGATGHWGAHGLATTTTGSVGVINGERKAAFGDSNALAYGGSDLTIGALFVRPAGYILTSSTAGVLQVRFAQNTSNATATVVVAGSWLRATKVVT